MRAESAYPRQVASVRVRVVNQIPFLQRQGVALDFESALSDDAYSVVASGAPAPRKALTVMGSVAHTIGAQDDHDLLLVHRLRLMTPFPGVDPPRRLDVYDLDDALFLGSPAEVNRRFQWAKQEARRSIACMRRARLVIAGNSFLAAHARRHAERVEVVPSLVDPTAQPLHEHTAGDVVTVGWIGSPTTAAYLGPVIEALAAINRPRERAKLTVVGADTRVRESWIEHRPWSLESESQDLAQFDIGVMPLPETDWARGKCGYKVLQYFSAGVPAVASPVGVAGELVGDDRGALASTSEEWRAALLELIEQPDQRRAQGAQGRQFAEREYSYDRWAPELAALLRSVATR